MRSLRKLCLLILLLTTALLLSGCMGSAVPFQYDLKLKTKVKELSFETGGGSAMVEFTIDSRRYQDLSSDQNIFLSYHILNKNGEMQEPDGVRTALAPIPARGVEKEYAEVVVPLEKGDYFVEIDLVEEGVTWFSTMGMPTLRIPLKVENTLTPDYSQIHLSSVPPELSVASGDAYQLSVEIQNRSGTGLYTSGSKAVTLSYHIKDSSGKVCAEGERIQLPENIRSETDLSIIFTPQSEILKQRGDYIIEIDLIMEGIAWFQEYGMQPLEIPITIR